MKVATQNTEVLPAGTVITLKQITDHLGLRHDRSMQKIDKLASEPSFGAVSYLDIVYNEQGQTTRTMALTKKQAIASGAKLDNSQLMKVIDIVESKSSDEVMNALKKQIENTKALFLTQEMVGETITDHDKRIKNLELNTRLEAWQEKALLDAKNKKVYELANGDEKLAKKLHRLVWSGFKKQFHIPRYNEVRQARYNDAIDWLNNISLADVV